MYKIEYHMHIITTYENRLSSLFQSNALFATLLSFKNLKSYNSLIQIFQISNSVVYVELMVNRISRVTFPLYVIGILF